MERYQNNHQIKFVKCSMGSPAGSRNQALSLAEGQFLAFLDADDWWHPLKLEKSVNALISSSSDICWHDEIVINQTTGSEVRTHFKTLENYYPDFLFRGNRLSTSTVVMRNPPRRESAALFDTSNDFWGTEDFMLWINLAKKEKKFCHFPEALTFYAVWEGSVSSNVTRNIENTINVIQYFLHSDSSLSINTRIKTFIFVARLSANVFYRKLLCFLGSSLER